MERGISGLTAASILASKNLEVHVFEKNANVGGRARVLHAKGFSFDMGPSWYWMPEVFEQFYNLFGHTASDFYQLKRLAPSFTVIFSEKDIISVPDNFGELCSLFESIEKGAAGKLRKFIKDAQKKYDVAMGGLIMKPGISLVEYMSMKTFGQALGINLFSSFASHVKKYFSHPYLISLLQFPILFLGSTPAKIPAMYSLMNYAAFKLGTWYPMGGFGKVIDAMKSIAIEQKVVFHTSEPVEGFEIINHHIHSLVTHKGSFNIDAVLGSADYNHIEQTLLAPGHRQYTPAYWDNRIMTPSSLIFYLGVGKKIKKFAHHNLFFDEDYDAHADEIYKTKKWPERPLFYMCCPSVTDPSVSPE